MKCHAVHQSLLKRIDPRKFDRVLYQSTQRRAASGEEMSWTQVGHIG